MDVRKHDHSRITPWILGSLGRTNALSDLETAHAHTQYFARDNLGGSLGEEKFC